ncbi:TPA: DNA adenine methylase [Yersinia enterocolitica]|nr:DNA adenine methylase [Yersinia enterocolitica]HDL7378320.1 DNA adenine methylase [Yersinia enterocolitica]
MGYRYIGSKVKVVDNVIGKISELCPLGGRVADLMSGTGIISTELRKRDYKVTANDLMTYSYHHSIVNLKFSCSPKFEKVIAFISECYEINLGLSPYENIINFLNNVNPKYGYFWNEFSYEGNPLNTEKPRNYFSPENARKLDGIRDVINDFSRDNLLSNNEKSLLLHDLIMAANDIANIAGTYGHYMSKLNGRALTALNLQCTDLFLKSDTEDHIVMQGYAEENASKIQCDLCYIDPPYMKRQYAANYHILETLARGDEPEAIGVSGLRPWRDQYSNFCTKTKIRDSFKTIIEKMECNDFLISYSEDGLLTIEDFISLLSDFGDVYIDTFSHKRFRSNNSNLHNELTEYLIHLHC